jgi:hypothetical protein
MNWIKIYYLIKMCKFRDTFFSTVKMQSVSLYKVLSFIVSMFIEHGLRWMPKLSPLNIHGQ